MEWRNIVNKITRNTKVLENLRSRVTVTLDINQLISLVDAARQHPNADVTKLLTIINGQKYEWRDKPSNS